LAKAAANQDSVVPPFLVILVNVVAALVLIAVASTGRLTRGRPRRSAALAGLPVLTAGLLTAYVFGEDSYRGNGISRWDAYRSPGGALGTLFVLSVALMVVYAAMIAYAALRGRDRLLRITAFATGITVLLLLIPTSVGFSLN
jgi:hypothetical protein